MHRDITPFNLFVCKGEILKLGDFGIAKHAPKGRGVPASTLNEAFAPSSALYNHSVWDQADDVWQVGQILATLVKGCVEGPIGKREVKGLPCSSQLKAVIRRAIGSKATRYRTAFELLQAFAPSRQPPDDFRVRLHSLRGKNVVFTGRLWTRRADAARLVLRCGGRVSGAVSARTDVIVQGAISSSYVAGTKGVKLIEAEAYRQRGRAITVISEARFRHLVAEHR